MKINTKAKLYYAFIFIFILLALSLAFTYKLAADAFDSNKEIFRFNEARVLTSGIMSKIESSYSFLGKDNELKKSIEAMLEEIGSKLQVVDTDGIVVFDSEENEANLNGKKIDIKTFVHFDAAFGAENPGNIRFAFPIVIEGKQAANAIFSIPVKSVMSMKRENKAAYILSPVFIGFFCLIVFILLFIIKVSQGIIDPLNSLNRSARQIAVGDLDFSIRYDKDNELGAFTKAFDMMKEELKESLRKQSEYEKARKELIASISHELKTPVASIKAYVEGLQDGIAKDKETTDRYLSVIKNKTDSLTKLIEDLLQHSLKELGKFKMNMEEMYCRQILRKVMEPLKVQFENSPIALTVDEPFPDVLVNMDSSRIEQVIVNLIQNAKKYTPPGGNIRFKAFLEKEYLKITVSDTGYGVSQEELPHIFDKFYRGERFTRDFEGSGLGLSICRYIVEQHGGEIFVESSINEGSTFTFTIPKV
ncbi:MAG: HAMP domain-containing histidine kinase [Clostridia bacterium]|nr:HAMP domain-containing histidine kinase [Clostridia bacterium]